jgi:hypothetical protein
MQGRDNLASAGLPDVVKRDRIVRPVPAPRLPHRFRPDFLILDNLLVRPPYSLNRRRTKSKEPRKAV